MARFEGARRLAVVAVLLSLALACGPDSPTHLAVSSVTPDNAASGVDVTVRGAGFRPGATVTFGGVKAEVLSLSSSSILVKVPKRAPGLVAVVVTNPDGESAQLVGFTLTLVLPPVSGTVVEFRATGEQVPVANLRLKVRARGLSGGALLATPLPDIVTDAQGRYTVNDTSEFVFFFQPDPESEYRFLCDWWPIVRSFPLRDLPVFHKTWSGNRPPSQMSLIEAGAWGTVSEQVDGSLQPVADATVLLDSGMFDPPATTRQNGFYMICQTTDPDPGPRTVTAFKTGYNMVTRDARTFGDVNIQLTRK